MTSCGSSSALYTTKDSCTSSGVREQLDRRQVQHRPYGIPDLFFKMGLGQTLHCGRTAGTCVKDHPEEMEGGNIKQHMRMQQHNRTI